MQRELLEHSFTVGSVDVDSRGEMKFAAILNMCQEVAYEHSTLMGFGYETLHELNLAWVLSRATIRIERMPLWRENIRVETWHKRQSGLFSLRDYIFYSAEGEPLVRVTTSWLIINLATRRITRLDRVASDTHHIEFHTYQCDAISEETERLDMPTETVSEDSHHVRYSDIDLNQHVNNAKYVEWLIDRAEEHNADCKRIKELVINFNHETLRGQIIDISSHTNALHIYLDGKYMGRNIFVSRLKYTTLL